MPRAGLPTGTVTFLFTDVEGSTRLLRELGAETYAAALAEHRRVIRGASGRHGGAEVDTQGDAFFVAFPTAPGALAAATELTEALVAGDVKVRVGLHTGTPLLAEEGYVGADVHRAARIAAAGHGGQVLVSASTASLIGLEGLRDLGEHRFKDLAAAERVFQLGDGEFPPLKSLYRTNLPVPATPFLGRERELAEVVELLTRDSIRLLTLTGTGGTGKTRLALQAVAEVADDFPDGVWWVPLATLRDPALVLETAAQALGSSDGLAEHIGRARLVVLFDNFEHVVDAADELAELLTRCPSLKLVATSREPLHLSGEQEYPVPPLTHGDGVAFFLARARAVRPEFAGDGDVPEFCRRLDDLPLALELAAARVKALAPRQILERLEKRFALLAAGTRDVPERQRTLRATIDWSHELLKAHEQGLFARLSVFAGGSTLDAAEAVADADLEGLQSLVDKSLIRFSGERYWMLETIRDYARDRLLAAGLTTGVKHRHADHYLAVAERFSEQAESGVFEPTQEAWVELLWREHDNFRQAFTWILDSGDRERALRLLVSLNGVWLRRDATREGCMWADRALSLTGSAGRLVEARGLLAAGGLLFFANETDRAEPLFLESLAHFREEGLESKIATVSDSLGAVRMARGDVEGARRYHEEGLEIRRRLGSDDVRRSLHFLGEAERDLGNLDHARQLLEESVVLAREAHDTLFVSATLHSIGDLELDAGNLDDAAARYRESLELTDLLGSQRLAAYCLAGLASVAAERGQRDVALRLWSVVEGIEDEHGVRLLQYERARYESRIAPLDRPAAARLSLEEAVEYALSLD